MALDILSNENLKLENGKEHLKLTFKTGLALTTGTYKVERVTLLHNHYCVTSSYYQI